MFANSMEQILFGNSLRNYLFFFLALFSGFLLVRFFKRIFLSRLGDKAAKNGNEFLLLLIGKAKKHLLPVVYFIVFYYSSTLLLLSSRLNSLINGLGLGLSIYYSIRFILALVNYGFRAYLAANEHDPVKNQVTRLLSLLIKFIIWGLALIILLDNLGIKISALVTGLGIGGIAVALAAQVVLSDFFSYFIIFFDRPFEIGDFIVIDDFQGTVEKIGLKTTRLRSLSGEQLIGSNTDLTGSRLRNYKRMTQRRNTFQIRVSYQTGTDQLKKIPQIIAQIIKATPDTRFLYAHLTTFGEYSLIYDVIYYVTTPDYSRFIDVKQEVNLKIIEEFEKEGINFTYPVQTLRFEKALAKD